ncbi:MAG: translation initiation factor Sui1 [Nitrincola lacisaponensis]|uniref:Translation initiation factor SUI1-related protein n=1 Tax=Nitrincola lacisaponensis TaxID=267850 RepID=A0A063XYC3_9GAMM|nr:translation initiation factor Sui1 [Nitrincola lacisaponensis]KDE39153.1 Translation initiation factor SUI1-related protein [Nitrincola lacisaponensis]
MKSLKEQLSGLVYSTETGQHCPDCAEPVSQCRCDQLADAERIASLDGIVRIRREVAGRKGKGVITITGVPLPEPELKALTKKLKQRCGTGGSLKSGVIEIQGDQRDLIKTLLEAEGFKVKLAGG